MEVEGEKGEAAVQLAVPLIGAAETNLLGKKVAEAASRT
jgi:uncharacterized protein YejL (UPF0352 family)